MRFGVALALSSLLCGLGWLIVAVWKGDAWSIGLAIGFLVLSVIAWSLTQ